VILNGFGLALRMIQYRSSPTVPGKSTRHQLHRQPVTIVLAHLYFSSHHYRYPSSSSKLPPQPEPSTPIPTILPRKIRTSHFPLALRRFILDPYLTHHHPRLWDGPVVKMYRLRHLEFSFSVPHELTGT
jgi:hypothetical protein